MGEYDSIPNVDPQESGQERSVSQSHRRVDIRHVAPSLVDPLSTDPLMSAFDIIDSDSDDGWVDDRTRSSGITENRSAQLPENEQAQGSRSSNRSSQDEASSSRQFSLWNTMLSAINRSHNTNTNTNTTTTTPTTHSDGVFGNLVAKEDSGENGEETNEEAHPPVDGEDENDDCTPLDQPPTYDEASADATPSYWETTILSTNFVDEVIVGTMAVGSPLSFAWALLLCCAFGIPACLGFYLFHNTHALKSGAFCGLGVNLIEISSDMSPERIKPPGEPPVGHRPIDPNSFQDGPPIGYTLHPTGQSTTETLAKPTDYTIPSRIVFAIGMFFLLKGVYDYFSALRTRAAIRQQQLQNQESSSSSQPTVEILHEEETVPEP